MPSSAHAHGLIIIISLIFVFIFLPNVNANGGAASMQMVMNESRRKLGSFQICALCTCCGGAKGICLPSPCCYAINCNIPNRPFGFCSFTPKTFKPKLQTCYVCNRFCWLFHNGSCINAMSLGMCIFFSFLCVL
ncbi:hypothetical protein GLYMA_20G219200v4 [Glycine max]|nr:hypothetical protein GLYMA_20G219200v4 [Glycine max]KAH1037352.1 hypothetical protein GYH30_056646 [Glycine max]